MNTVNNTGDTNQRSVQARTTSSVGTRRRRCTRSLAGLVVGLVAGVATICGVAPVASAAVGATSGSTGYTQVFQGSCKYVRTNVSGSLRTVTPPPRIYGINYTAGNGNDAQRVRYTVHALEVGTGRVLYSSGYSGLAWAWDNSPAVFSGSSTIDVYDWRANFQVVYLIQWLNNAGQVLGSKTEYVDSYQHYSAINAGPYGPLSSCKKYY